MESVERETEKNDAVVTSRYARFIEMASGRRKILDSWLVARIDSQGAPEANRRLYSTRVLRDLMLFLSSVSPGNIIGTVLRIQQTCRVVVPRSLWSDGMDCYDIKAAMTKAASIDPPCTCPMSSQGTGCHLQGVSILAQGARDRDRLFAAT